MQNLFHFYTFQKYDKTSGFLMFSRGIEIEKTFTSFFEVLQKESLHNIFDILQDGAKTTLAPVFLPLKFS